MMMITILMKMLIMMIHKNVRVIMMIIIMTIASLALISQAPSLVFSSTASAPTGLCCSASSRHSSCPYTKRERRYRHI